MIAVRELTMRHAVNICFIIIGRIICCDCCSRLDNEAHSKCSALFSLVGVVGG